MGIDRDGEVDPGNISLAVHSFTVIHRLSSMSLHIYS